jgi:ribosomal protein S18 acetylase RimI-like enzyme
MKITVDFAVKQTAPAERDAVIAVLVAAFENDPVCRWFFPSSLGYHALFPKIVDALGGRAFAHGGVYHAEGFTGAALWLPPGVEPDGPAIDAVVQQGVLAEKQATAFAVFEQMGRGHPEGPHWYLPFVGVLPNQQGRGVGSALLEASLARCDAEGLPAYLESTHPRNVPLYQRYGFEVSGEIRAGDCPGLIPMIRPARVA